MQIDRCGGAHDQRQNNDAEYGSECGDSPRRFAFDGTTYYFTQVFLRRDRAR